MDPRGIEPRPHPCHGRVIPLYYGPQVRKYYKNTVKTASRIRANILLTFCLILVEITGTNRTTTMTVEPVLCAERAQPIAKGQKAFIVTLGNHTQDHTISESVFLRLPVSKQLKRKLKPNELGIHVYNTIIDEAGVPKKGDFLFSMSGSLAEISAPRLWEKHFNN